MCPQEWSLGGGLHFAGRWRATGTPVLVKLGLSANELYWTTHIAEAAPDLVPTLFAAGNQLGDLLLGWAAMEQIPYGPLGPLWQGHEFEMTLEAGVRFHEVAAAIPAGDTATVDASVLRSWLEEGLHLDPPGPAEKVAARAEEDLAWVIDVIGRDVCHHDLHLCNVVTRTPPPLRSRGLLLDVAAVIQPWAFDAAYLQVLNSGDSQRPGSKDLVPKMADLRHEHGLRTCAGRELERLSAITLAWFAMRQWSRNPERHTIPDYAEAT
jgi:hypothetical protein